MAFCSNCGSELRDGDKFCEHCGAKAYVPTYAPPIESEPLSPGMSGAPVQTYTERGMVQPESARAPYINAATSTGAIRCPKCGSLAVSMQIFQETVQSVTAGTSSVDVREKRHGFFWWLFVGWWWMIIKGILWIVAFIPMAIIRAGRRKKYKGNIKTVNTTKNIIRYKNVCTCQSCGNIWERVQQ